MIRLFRFGLDALCLLLITPALFAAAWVGGRGAGNAGAYPSTPFPAAPALYWKSYRGDAFAGSTPSDAIVVGKKLVLAFEKTLLAVSTETGELSWKQALSDMPVGDLLLLDEQIIVTLGSGKLAAYNPADGSLVWDRKFTGKLLNNPSFTDDILAVATDSNMIGVLARKTGKTIASVNVESEIEAAPLQLGKAILLCTKKGKILRIEGGSTKWTVTLPKGEIHTNTVTNGQLMLVCAAETVYALNTTSMTQPFRWTYPCPGLVGSPIIGNGLVYLATASGQLHAIDVVTGKERWGARGVALPAPPIAAPLLIGEVLFVRMKYGLMATYTQEKGLPVWSYRLPVANANQVVGAPVVDGGNLYFGVSDGSIYRLSGAMPDVDPPAFRKVLPTMAGTDFANARPLEFVGAVIEDEGSGVQPNSVTIMLDGTDLTKKIQSDVQSGYYFAWLTPAAVPEPGLHTLVMTAKDQRGNTGTLTTRFYVGNEATTERVPITINGEFLPKQLKVRPGTILEWINEAGSARTVIADEKAFTSDTSFPKGIPDKERWVWVVPADAQAGTKYSYHCRLRGEAGTGKAAGPGLTGIIEIVDPRRDQPGLPKVTPASLPAFPTPDFLK